VASLSLLPRRRYDNGITTLKKQNLADDSC